MSGRLTMTSRMGIDTRSFTPLEDEPDFVPRRRGRRRAAYRPTLPDRYLEVRTAFVARGSSLSRWCRENGVNRRYAELALRAALTGEKARALRARILDAAGVTE